MLQTMPPQTFAEFYQDFYPRLYRFIFSRTEVTQSDADDLAQDTLLEAWRNKERFLGESTYETWILSIAKHKIADSFRKVSTRNNKVQEVRRALTKLDTQPIPEDLLATSEMRQRVAEALRACNPVC